MQNKRLVILSYGFGLGEVFGNLFDEVLNIAPYKFIELKEGDTLLFEGGADINTHFYDEEANSFTGYFDKARDAVESAYFKKAVALGIPMIGICRGAQLACALSGGKLVQHVSGHTVNHPVINNEGLIYNVTSAHHQMMDARGVEHTLLAWVEEPISNNYYGESDLRLNIEVEPEIIWFPTTKSLAIQGHPEWADSNSTFVKECCKYVEQFILGEE